jgi:hypothetical protein
MKNQIKICLFEPGNNEPGAELALQLDDVSRQSAVLFAEKAMDNPIYNRIAIMSYSGVFCCDLESVFSGTIKCFIKAIFEAGE